MSRICILHGAVLIVSWLVCLPSYGGSEKAWELYADSVVGELQQPSGIAVRINEESRVEYKKELLERIPGLFDTTQMVQPPLWLEELVVTTLHDTSSTVAGAAADIAGELRLTGIASELVETCRLSRQRYGRWSQGIEPNVIRALGRIGGTEAFTLLSELAEKYQSTFHRRGAVLAAIAETGNPRFVDVLDKVIEHDKKRIDHLIKTSDNPDYFPTQALIEFHDLVDLRNKLAENGGSE